MIGRPELCFWRLFALCAVLVCVANIFVLIGVGNFTVREKIVKDITHQKQMEVASHHKQTEVSHHKQTEALSVHNISSVPVNKSPVSPSTNNVKSIDLTKVSVKNPLWLSVLDVSKFLSPDKILMLGRRREKKGYLVIGVPTVHRAKAYYLSDTVKWLVNHLPQAQHDNVVIVIFVADFDHIYREKVVKDIKEKFPSAVEEGLIQVIQAMPEYYPNLDNLPLLYGDKANRVKWRSKQSLDYSFMYYYCADLAEYYIQLEDDVLTVANYYTKIKSFLDKKERMDWSTIEFGARGFIGMTYRTKHLKSLARFSRFYFWTMPIDWIFRVFNDIFLFGNDRKNVLSPPVFKHIGEYSSLNGQRRKLEDLNKRKEKKDHITHIYQPKNGNPAATITTTIVQFVQGHEIGKAYSNEGYFWGKTIKTGLYVEIVLQRPTVISRIVIPSGSPLYPLDSFLDTGLAISTSPYVGHCVNFKEVGKFVDTPVIDHTFNGTQPVYCIRLTIDKVRKDAHSRARWLIIREIALL